MAGFHPPKHNYIVFDYNGFLCGKKKREALASQALGSGSEGKKSKHTLLRFNDVSHTGKQINDPVCEKHTVQSKLKIKRNRREAAFPHRRASTPPRLVC